MRPEALGGVGAVLEDTERLGVGVDLPRYGETMTGPQEPGAGGPVSP